MISFETLERSPTPLHHPGIQLRTVARLRLQPAVPDVSARTAARRNSAHSITRQGTANLVGFRLAGLRSIGGGGMAGGSTSSRLETADRSSSAPGYHGERFDGRPANRRFSASSPVTTTHPLPLPPLDLLQRAGHVGDDDPQGAYLRLGFALRRQIDAILPSDWSWKGKRVLDFGCGAGKVLRHFAPEATEAEFWGCDIHEPSIEWVQRNICPPFRAFTCREDAGLPQPDGYFDLIFALSVYTHITDHWAEWLLEHHRALASDGLLLATFLGEGMSEQLTNEPWREDRIGMNMIRAGNPWDLGGPTTLLSPWWLRAHWGRAFEVLDLWPYMAPEPRPPAAEDPPMGQGMILLRRKPVRLVPQDLARLEPDEPRELQALQHNVRQLRDETVELRRQQNELELRGQQNGLAFQLRRRGSWLSGRWSGRGRPWRRGPG